MAVNNKYRHSSCKTKVLLPGGKVANTNTQTTNCPKCGRLNLPEGHAGCPGVNRTSITSERRDDLTRAAVAGLQTETAVDQSLEAIQAGCTQLETALLAPSRTGAPTPSQVKEINELGERMDHLRLVVTNQATKATGPETAQVKDAVAKPSLMTRAWKRVTAPRPPKALTPRDLFDQKAVEGKIDQSTYMRSQF